MRIRELTTLTACVAALALGAAGCSEDVACVSDSECPTAQVCSGGFCEAAPASDAIDGSGDPDTVPGDTGGGNAQDTAGGADAVPDTGAGDGGGTPDTNIPDAGGAGDTGGGATDAGGHKDTVVEWDLGGGEPDETPPYVQATTPAVGEEGVPIPFTVTITFSEPMRTETIDENNIRLLSLTGKSIGGKPVLSADKTSVTLTPEAGKLSLVSPYTIKVDPIVQDVAGNHLEAEFLGTFYTAAPANLGAYAQLAAQLAPTAHVAINTAKPVLSYPTRFDADGNWEGIGNAAWVQEKAKSLPAAVYWDVAETKSHIFLTYTYFWPYRDTTGTPKPAHANDTAGVLIVAEKLPELTPIAAYTYGRSDEVEEVFAWVSAGSILDGKPNVTKAVAPEILFEDGRFQGYLTTPLHQACTWVASGSGACELNAGIQATLATVVYGLDQGVATTVQAEGGKWPQAGESIDFQLLHGLTAFWPRRDSKGEGGVYGATFDYEPMTNRPGSALKGIPSIFVAPDGSYGGRPAWAWGWKPATGGFYQMGRGTIFIDPAIFVAKRHSLDTNWDAEAKTGYSVDYCFEPYLGIDNRGTDPDCPAE